MVSETDALKRLSNWEKSFGWRVLQDKKNENENPLFHVTGKSTKKPDLIGILPNGYVIAQEVKSGDESRELGVYSKLVTYYQNYNNGDTLYFDENDNPILINFFVIGTYYSLEGRLRPIEYLHMDSPRGSSKHGWTRLDAVDYGCCPKIEYNTTFDITRQGIWFNIDNEKNRGFNTGIGTLLSTVLDGNGCKPGIHIKRPEIVFKNGQMKRYWKTKWITF
jgi:hypothetical protein